MRTKKITTFDMEVALMIYNEEQKTLTSIPREANKNKINKISEGLSTFT
ncbi:unnamed protein product [Nezara viridula]|uniref:Uncharacterized protein n=1 Tax=Nezara viridula TaxID=85310 RepID=A0A9P0EHD2_NEZVI|nr:unnamed protein product [Nezara viridula]